ncbi:coiled-coil domain-containing protein 86 [Pieris rapae]|uniref:coiled-coil domain-containing protein 86 n=1 Tax=Pieris rapae TaxID=64459 RepID=UPI001E27B272|nr:coiled-coil domain-containing protein 86 [Pieris rapae]
MASGIDSEAKVLSILDNIKSQGAKEETSDDKKKCTKNIISKKKTEANVMRGIPKSGRFWKSKKERFNTIVKTKGIRLNFEKKTALRIELQKTKELSRQIIAEVNEKEQAKKERRRENIRRTLENKKKSEVVQVISNTKKLKRMKKKQLRFIEKRDTTKTVATNKSE